MKFIKELLKQYKKYQSDREVLMRLDIPEGSPILSFEGFMQWLKKHGT